MRNNVSNNGVSLQVIAGTHVVFLGFNVSDDKRNKLLGFAIRRTDETEHERYWLRGLKTFKEVVPHQVPGRSYPTYEHPIQSFQWADYTAKPDHNYVYEIVPMYGEPKYLTEGPGVQVVISTESETGNAHGVFFNRGVAASQAYANRFQNRKPYQVPDRKAYIWLSRGLEEAMLAFIGQANSSDYSLRAAVYEFNYEPVLLAFKKAHKDGADVRIIYDARKEQPRKTTEKAIEKVHIKRLVKPRKAGKSYISHNKFIVLLKHGKPIQIWTGSTNITKGGIFGQSNVGHIVRDETVAKAYYDYWLQLKKDLEPKQLRAWIETHIPDPQGLPASPSIQTLFSPRRTLRVLKWYGEQLDFATDSANLTAAFGVNKILAEILGKTEKEELRYLLLERHGNTKDVYERDRDVQIAVGTRIGGDVLYGWTREALTDFNVHVRYVHTKYMLVDPLSNHPIVITGSANFSDASTKKNDENMLVIAGNHRVAHTYFGEFMRLFSHYYFRDLMRKQQGENITTPRALYLASDDSWTDEYYTEGSIKHKKRILFAG